MDSPIDHPTITVPGRGAHVVKFGLGAQVRLEKKFDVTMEEVGRRLQEAAPRTVNGELVPGRISPAFLFDVLSACLWKQLHLDPDDLADCFESFDQIGEVARVVMIAFTKTRWSAGTNGQASATATTGQAEQQVN